MVAHIYLPDVPIVRRRLAGPVRRSSLHLSPDPRRTYKTVAVAQRKAGALGSFGQAV
jgi:hypothetical protein